MIRKRVWCIWTLTFTLCVYGELSVILSALQGSVGKIETNAAVDDGDESAAKRLKSEDADKPADTAANEQ